MSARGPAPKAGKTPIFAFRLRPKLRSELEAAAQRSGNNLSEEVTYRLKRTLREDREFEARYGGRASFRMANILGIAIDRTREKYGNRNWLEDAEVFDFTMEVIVSALGASRPGGGYLGPGQRGLEFHLSAKDVARAIWTDIAEYNPDDLADPYANIAEELGSVVARPNIYHKEYRERVSKRIKELMMNAGMNLDWEGLPDEEISDLRKKRSTFIRQAQDEVEMEMIKEGRDPRREEEDTF